MDKGKEQMIQAAVLLEPHKVKHAKEVDHQWLTMEGGDDDNDDTISASSIDNSSSNSINGSTSSLDLVDDASSPTSSALPSSCSSNSNGPLFELSELMANLPIKRGLSKYYEGKSQSFTSLSSISSIEDLAKKEFPCRKKLKASNSYGNGSDARQKPSTLPKAIVSKKISRGSVSSLSFTNKRGNFFRSTRPPLAPVHRKF